MKKLLLSGLLVVSLMTGCARNYYNVPTENVADKVRTLGIAPIFTDADSDIRHPQKDLLVQLVTDLNRKYEPQLARKLKATGNFYTVALLDSDPVQLFASLLFRREKRDDASILYNKYFWKNEELRSYIQKNNLDAVLLLTVSGLTRNDKIYSSNLLKSLETDYNYLTLAAQMLDANGTILWEYPNFRQRILSYSPLINLQYPDFSESDANLSGKTEVKFKTLDGLRRALEHKQKDWLLRETTEPEEYSTHFDEIVSMIKYDLGSKSKDAPAPTESSRQRPVETTRSSDSKPDLSKTEALPQSSLATQPKAVEPPKTPAVSTETQTPATDEIVPATGSTR